MQCLGMWRVGSVGGMIEKFLQNAMTASSRRSGRRNWHELSPIRWIGQGSICASYF